MNAISQIHTDQPYKGQKSPRPHSHVSQSLPPLHTIASLIYTGDGKAGLEEKSVPVKWIGEGWCQITWL